jgi:SpoIIAA-like
MLTVSDESSGNILILEARSKLTDEDYKQLLIPRLEEIIREHGKARLLLDMGDEFEGWEPKAAWDDARFGVAHRRDFEKMAVIADRRWVEWAFKISAPFISGEMKAFAPSERAEAHRWIKT